MKNLFVIAAIVLGTVTFSACGNKDGNAEGGSTDSTATETVDTASTMSTDTATTVDTAATMAPADSAK